VNGVITVGGAIPHCRHFRHAGLPLVLMAGVIVPATTAVFGFLPSRRSEVPESEA